MDVAVFQFSLFGINTYVVFDRETLDCAIVDPGMINDHEEKAMTDFITRNNLRVTSIINTHLHIDHAVGNSFLSDKFKSPVLANRADVPLGERMTAQAQMFGLNREFNGVKVDKYLKDGDTVKIGTGTLKVLAVPGHSQGSIALYDEADGFVIVGDALFNGSVGRTDLPGGNHAQLIESIEKKLLSLPGDTVVYSGHGEPTTISREKTHNPFLK